jgi:hypothetical protein
MNNKPTTFKAVRAIARTMKKVKWIYQCGGPLRNKQTDECPLAFVARVATGRKFPNEDFVEAARVLGINEFLGEEIVNSADGFRENKLRRILLKAAGFPT